MIEQVPVIEKNVYYTYEFTDRIVMYNDPMEAFVDICHEWIARNNVAGLVQDLHLTERSQIDFAETHDLNVILYMIAVVGGTCSYLYDIDKERCPVSGPADDVWSILRRQAEIILHKIVSDSPPAANAFTFFFDSIGVKTTIKRSKKRIIVVSL